MPGVGGVGGGADVTGVCASTKEMSAPDAASSDNGCPGDEDNEHFVYVVVFCFFAQEIGTLASLDLILWTYSRCS